MYIQKLDIQHFGKYNKQEIELQHGINVIYGANEAGKTTIKDFIIGMFYGIERQRGIAAKTDAYTRREPFDGTGYAGSMTLHQEGQTYVIDRTFRKDQKEFHVYQQETGRQLASGEDYSLNGVLIDLDKNGYTNTLCISSSGAAYKSELQEELRSYLMNVNETHTGNLDLQDAYAYLNQQKKALNCKSCRQELNMLANKLEDVSFDEKLAEIGEKRQQLERQLLDAPEEREEPVKQKTSGGNAHNNSMDPQLRQIMNFIKVFFAFGVFAIVLLLIYILPISVHYKLWLCVIAIVVILYVWIHSEIKKYRNRSKERSVASKREPTVKERVAPEKQSGGNLIELTRQLSDIQVQENDLLREYARQQELQTQYDEMKEQLTQSQQKADAIDLAVQTIQELAGDIYDQYAPGMSRRVSDMVSRMTKGKYTDVRLDEKLNIQVRKDGKYLGAEFLSTGTLEQIYLAVRLAVAQEMSKTNMPLLLDDVFGSYDDARLEEALQCIAGYEAEQVILFTANNRLADILDQTDIEYNYIEL